MCSGGWKVKDIHYGHGGGAISFLTPYNFDQFEIWNVEQVLFIKEV